MNKCSDGLGRTGTFIAIWSLIEQMKAEGQIDVVGTIKSIRTQRPGAVPLLVSVCDTQGLTGIVGIWFSLPRLVGRHQNNGE